MKLNTLERMFVTSRLRERSLAGEARRILDGVVVDGGIFLEIGCGHGAGTFAIAAMTGCRAVVGIDIDPVMLGKARRRIARPSGEADCRPPVGIHLAGADSCRLPFPDGIFDGAAHFFVLDHVPDWRVSLDEVYRVLRPGAVYAFEDAFIPDSRVALNRLFGHVPITADGLRDALTKTGFTIESYEEGWRGRRCYVRARKQP